MLFVKEKLLHVYKNSGKPIIKGLPKTTITAIGELAVLTCEVSGDPQASVTWTKDGLSSIPRAQFENNEKILIIRDVVPDDSGVYECKAMNMFGKSRTATIVIVAGTQKVCYVCIEYWVTITFSFPFVKQVCEEVSEVEKLPTSAKINDQSWFF